MCMSEEAENVIRRIVRDTGGAAYLWVVAWDRAFYYFRKWRLTPFDVRALETWERMMALRRSNGLPELPPPDLDCRTKWKSCAFLSPSSRVHSLTGSMSQHWNGTPRNSSTRSTRSILTHALLLECSVRKVCAAFADRVLLFELRRNAMNALTLEMPAPGLATKQRNGIARAEPAE